jgi:hypothetical protein
MAHVNRRDFLATAMATAGASRFTVPRQFEAAAPGSSPSAQVWYDRAMRWMQLILVENDPGRFDPDFWLDLFRRTHTDGLSLSAGGVVAYYPTRISYHHRSTAMKDGDDPFGYLVRGCQKLGMCVIARTDSHAVLDDAAAAHPEWVARDSEGRPRRHWEMPETRLATCAYGPYNFEFMTDVHREIVSVYGVDGVFCNRWQGSGLCYCDACKRQFRSFAGSDLPRAADAGDPIYVRYVAWTQERLEQLWGVWDGALRAIKPSARYISNSGMDIERAARLSPTYILETQSRGNTPPWSRGRSAKEFRAYFGSKPLIGNSNVLHSSRRSVGSEAELRIWMLEGIANGTRPWLGKTSGVVSDTRWVSAMEKVYDWHYRNEAYLRNEENLATVAVVFGPDAFHSPSVAAELGMVRSAPFAQGATSGTSAGAERSSGANAHLDGICSALVEARIPFEMVSSRLLEPEHTDRYRLLIAPSVAALSDAECELLRAYVRRGGSLMATYQTSLRDGRGGLRRDFGLGDLFGVTALTADTSNGSNSYMSVNRETRHPILRGIETFGQIMNAARRVDVRAVASFQPPPLTRIPTFPTIPMEEVYPREPETGIPEVYLREIGGNSRIVYFPGDIDRTFWNGQSEDHALLLRNAFAWAMNALPPVVVRGPGLLDITCWRQARSMTVHLVNLTNPMMWRSAYREFIPIGAQEISIRLPKGETARGARLLVGGQTLSVARAGDRITVTVPTVVDHEVVAIDF